VGRRERNGRCVGLRLPPRYALGHRRAHSGDGLLSQASLP
jgi:hypothetical protein